MRLSKLPLSHAFDSYRLVPGGYWWGCGVVEAEEEAPLRQLTPWKARVPWGSGVDEVSYMSGVGVWCAIPLLPP